MMTELLSPAGNINALQRAVHAGADAIYLGGLSFGARAYAANFSYDELEQAINYAHTYGVKIYVTVNTLVYQSEKEEWLRHVARLCELGADALIMQDAGMIDQVRQRWPEMPIHASTQMHNHSDAALEYVGSLGAVRAVLAREMTIEQIKELRCSIEKEVFVHGALCIGSSGQCLMSALTLGRSGNRGQCAQSCRMRYRLLDGAGRAVQAAGRYLLSPKDIAVLEDIRLLLDAGVCCFKIEGRMKSPEYVYQVTKIYAGLLHAAREGRPLKVPPEDIEDLKKLFNRGFTHGHLLDDKGDALMSIKRPNHAGVPLGTVLSAGHDGIRLALAAPLRQGDGIKFEESDDGFFCNRILKDGLLVNAAQSGDVVTLEGKAEAKAGDHAVKTSDVEVIARLSDGPERKVPIKGRLRALVEQPLHLSIWDADGHTAEAAGESVAEGRTRPSTAEELRDSAGKLGGTPYEFECVEVDTDGQAFVAKSVLNALRREVVQRLTDMRTQIRKPDMAPYTPPVLRLDTLPDRPLLHVLIRSEEQLDAVCSLVTGDIYTEDAALYTRRRADCPALRIKTDRLASVLPPMQRERLLITDHGGLHVYAPDNDAVLDYTAGALNADALTVYFRSGVHRIALSPELNMDQTAEMLRVFFGQYGQLPPVEALVYARHELMALRHCVIRHALGGAACGRCRRERFSLQDDAGRLFPILTTERCENRLFEGAPAQKEVGMLRDMGIRHFRVELMDEDADQSKKIVTKYKQLMEDGI
jgi:putative protease